MENRALAVYIRAITNADVTIFTVYRRYVMRGSAFAEEPIDDEVRMRAQLDLIDLGSMGFDMELDTFDPKPDAGYDYCGQLDKAIPTNVDGIQIGQLLTELAKQADKYSLIRGMTHGVNAHETASYMVQTGRPSGGRDVYPCVGAVASLFKGYDAGYKGLIPPYVVLTRPQGRFSEEGFLGPKLKPFATGGDPAQKPFMVEGVSAYGGATVEVSRDRVHWVIARSCIRPPPLRSTTG